MQVCGAATIRQSLRETLTTLDRKHHIGYHHEDWNTIQLDPSYPHLDTSHPNRSKKAMTITRVGSNEKYAEGWAAAFGKGKPAKKAAVGKSAAAAKSTAKASATKKSVAKKAPAKKAAPVAKVSSKLAGKKKAAPKKAATKKKS